MSQRAFSLNKFGWWLSSFCDGRLQRVLKACGKRTFCRFRAFSGRLFLPTRLSFKRSRTEPVDGFRNRKTYFPHHFARARISVTPKPTITGPRQPNSSYRRKFPNLGVVKPRRKRMLFGFWVHACQPVAYSRGH